MLLELRVSNFAIIDNISLTFAGGLNILSGETGAGKSILLKSLALLMGGKASSEMIRAGEERAIIEGCFDLNERADIIGKLNALDIPVEDQTLLVRRVVSSRSRIYLNNTLCTLANLRDIVSPLVEVAGQTVPLIEMTSQHDNKNLMNKSGHIDMLDHYVGTRKLHSEYQTRYQSLKELQKRIHDLSEKSKEREQQLDFYRYQVDEIDQLELSIGDELRIEESVNRLKNVDKVLHFFDRASDTLYSSDHSLIAQISQLRSQCDDLARMDSSLRKYSDSLQEAASMLNDIVYDIRDESSSMELNSDELERQSERLNLLRKLQKKFGQTAEEILDQRKYMVQEIDDLNQADSKLEELIEAERVMAQEIAEMAESLHRSRLNGGTLLSESVNEELSDLNMKGVCFEVAVQKATHLNSNGISEVEFLTRNSKKDPAMPLGRAASGGELSRILLALKRVIGRGDFPRTFLFDEVDTGVSGPTAEKVGRKLRSIARGQQVICVTHLPQVAAFADNHFLIEKDASSVKMQARSLKNKNRVSEIARLLSGEKITDTSLAHATQLLTDSK